MLQPKQSALEARHNHHPQPRRRLPHLRRTRCPRRRQRGARHHLRHTQRTPMTHEALQPAIHRLADACADLADPRRHTIHLENGYGTRRRIHLPPRYTQLQQAIKTHSTAGHTTAFGSRPPLGLKPLHLLTQIDEAIIHMHPPPGGWPGWTLIRLHALPHQPWRPQDTNHVNLISKQLENFTRRIDDLFDPPRPPIQLRQPCPICVNITVLRHIDGELVRQAALLLTSEECRCQHCGAHWAKDQLEFLGKLLNDQTSA